MIATILVAIAIALAVALAAALTYAGTAPDTFTIRRSTLIAAPPEAIFPLINDWQAQSSWSPFEKDPNMKRRYSGAGRQNTVDFVLEPQGSGTGVATKVTWAIAKLTALVETAPKMAAE
jgi:hypothetical protein